MPHNFKDGRFLFNYPQEILSNLSSVFQGFGIQNGTLPPFQLLSQFAYPAETESFLFCYQLFFLHSIWRLLKKAFFYLVLSVKNHPASTYFVGLCAASATHGQNPACGSTFGQWDQLQNLLFSSLRGLIWYQNQTAALVQPNCIDHSGLDVSKGYESCGERISSEQIHALFFLSLHHDIKMELARAMKSL